MPSIYIGGGKRKMQEIKKEIQLASYWEHFKYAKDLALILPVEHPKRKKAEKIVNELAVAIKNI